MKITYANANYSLNSRRDLGLSVLSMAMEDCTDTRLPSAAWAWQGLRRNSAYRKAFKAYRACVPETRRLASGAHFLNVKKHCPEAERFGLLCFADPTKSAVDANVLWRPERLAGALRVSLSPYDTHDNAHDEDHDIIVLSALKTRRVIFDAHDGMRHILLAGERFWVQLFAHPPYPDNDDSIIRIRIDEALHGMRRLDTAAQLLSLHRSAGGKLSLIGRRKKPTSVVRALGAFDIWHGFERPKGDLEDVAAFLCGDARTRNDWNTKDRNLRVQARRWVKRGEEFVEQGYLDLLTRKTL